MHDMWPTRRSHRHNDFAELAILFQIAVRIPHLLEFECAVDDRPQCPACKTLNDVLHSHLPGYFVAGHLPEAVPLDAGCLADHCQYGYRSVPLTEYTVDIHDALMGQRRNQLREIRPSDWIESDACTIAVRDAQYFGDHILLISCDNVCGSRVEQLVFFCRSAGQGD